MEKLLNPIQSTKSELPARASFRLGSQIAASLCPISRVSLALLLAVAFVQVKAQTSQTINFTPPPSQVSLGVAPITLAATASSGLPVSFSVSSTGADAWSIGAPMPYQAIGAMPGVPGDGNIYMIGGYSGTQSPPQLNFNRQYNPSTNTWTLKSPMPTPRYGGGTVSIDGILYVAGGWGPYIPYEVLEAYNPSTDSWTELASLSHFSGCGIAGAIQGKMYLFTPCNGYSGYYSLFDVYDPVANTWTSLPSGPTSHSGGTGDVFNGKFYVVGGVDSAGGPTAELDVYDPVTGSWGTLAPMPVPLINLQGGFVNGKLYVVGGETDTAVDTFPTTTYVYDPVANSWSTQTPPPTSLWAGSSVSAYGLLYIAGGYEVAGGSNINTLNILSPGVCTIAGNTLTITGVGVCTVSANQAGNGAYEAAPEVLYNITVNANITPSVTWTAPAAIVYGTPLGSAQLDAMASVPGTFTYSPNTGSLLAAGPHTLSVMFTPSTPTGSSPITATVPLTVNKANTTTSVAVATTQTVNGTTATLTTKIIPQVSGTPTGTVTYSLDVQGNVTTLGVEGVGEPFTTPVLAVGTNTVIAVYNGDGNFNPSGEAVYPTGVKPTAVTLSLLSGLAINPVPDFYSIAIPTQSGKALSGTVTLYDGSTPIGTTQVPATGQLGLVALPTLAGGTHNLKAVYSGNSAYPPGESSVVTLTVINLL